MADDEQRESLETILARIEKRFEQTDVAVEQSKARFVAYEQSIIELELKNEYIKGRLDGGWLALSPHFGSALVTVRTILHLACAAGAFAFAGSASQYFSLMGIEAAAIRLCGWGFIASVVLEIWAVFRSSYLKGKAGKPVEAQPSKE